jgi:3-oxoacyl-[acyl-carrier protein] reductase
MDFGLKARTALVLGGGGGLGWAISKALIGEGADVAVADIDPDGIRVDGALIASI